jgi:hypothetical protein
MSLPISNLYNNILTQCPKQPALPLHPEEVDIMERHGNKSGIYIRSSDERLVIAEVYKPGWATHLKTRSGSYTGAPTYVKYFIPIDNEQYGKLVEHLFKLITLGYRCYEHSNSELRRMSFTSIVNLFENILTYTAEEIQCEIKRLINERYRKRYRIRQGTYRQYGGTKEFSMMELQLNMNAALEKVFDWKIAQNGTYKGKKVAYEPMNDAARKKSYAAIEKIAPSLGKSGRGREWFQRIQGLQKWFENQNMRTDFYKVETTNRNNRTGKEYMWVTNA